MAFGTRSGRIDSLRGVAIALVLLHHFSIAYDLRDTALARVFGAGAVHAVVRNGNYGVTMFFVVSGFLIAANAQARSGRLGDLRFGPFYRRRAARILPSVLLLLALVNALAFAGVAIFRDQVDGGARMPLAIVDLASLIPVMNVLLVKAGWVNYALCVLWSLSVEEAFYLAFPIFCRVLRRERALVACCLCFVLIGPVWRATHQGDTDAALYDYFACFDAIAIGVATAILLAGRTIRSAWLRPAQVVVALVLAAFYLAASIADTNVLGVTLFALGTAVLVLPAADMGGVARRHPALGGLRATGRLSLELYLFHLVVLGLLRTAWPHAAGNARLALLAAFLALSVLAAGLVAALWSEPLNRAFRDGMASDRRATRGQPVASGD